MRKLTILILALAFVLALPGGAAAADEVYGVAIPTTLKESYTFSGTNTYSGASTFSGAVTASSTLTVTGAATFNGNVTLGNATTDTLTITATPTINANATLTVSGPIACNGTVGLGNAAGDTVTITGNATANGTLSTTSTTTLGDGTSDAITVNGTLGVTTTNSAARFGDGTYSWDHSPEFGVEPTAEFDGTVYFDGATTTAGTLTASGSATLGDATTDAVNVAGTFSVTTTNTVARFGDGTYSWDHSPSGIAVEPDSEFDGHVYMDGAATVAGTLTSSGAVTLGDATTDAVTVNGSASFVTTNTVLAVGDGTYSWDHSPSGIAVENDSEFDGTVYMDGAATVAGTLTSSASATLGDATTDTLTVNSTASFVTTNTVLAVGDGTYSWDHSPSGIAVETASEFDGTVYMDGAATVAGNFSASGDSLSLGDATTDALTVTATTGFADNAAVTVAYTLAANGDTTLGNARTDTITVGGRFNGAAYAVTSVTTEYTATATDDAIICNTSGGAFSILLPAVSTSTGKVYYIARNTSAGTNAVTIDPNASELIDGASTYADIDATGDGVTIVCDGTEWIIVGAHIH